ERNSCLIEVRIEACRPLEGPDIELVRIFERNFRLVGNGLGHGTDLRWAHQCLVAPLLPPQHDLDQMAQRSEQPSSVRLPTQFDQDQTARRDAWSVGPIDGESRGQRPWSIARYRARPSSTGKPRRRALPSTRCAFHSTARRIVRSSFATKWP